MPRVRATCAVAGTDAANNGPRMISAPSSMACCAPCCAPWAEPASSLISSWIFGFWNSDSAISAAFFIDCAATPALPAADSGRTRPTLTCPVPTATGCCGGPAGAGEEPKLLVSDCWTPEQALSKGAPMTRPNAVRRVVPGRSNFALDGSVIVALSLFHNSDSDRPEHSFSDQQDGWIQAYCRR